jgi:hypothetical protein
MINVPDRSNVHVWLVAFKLLAGHPLLLLHLFCYVVKYTLVCFVLWVSNLPGLNASTVLGNGAHDENRTRDLPLTKGVLYR